MKALKQLKSAIFLAKTIYFALADFTNSKLLLKRPISFIRDTLRLFITYALISLAVLAGMNGLLG